MNRALRAAIFALIFVSCQPVGALESHDFATKTLVIDAPPAAVFEAIRAQRSNAARYRRLISGSGSDYVCEQGFHKLPVLGNAVCQYSEHETGNKRIEYKMIKSDKLVAFEGEWVLTPVCEGKTSLKLTSYVDTGLRIPFSRKVTHESTKRSVEKRLIEVEQVALANKARLLSLAK